MSLEGLFIPILNRVFRQSRPIPPQEGLLLGTVRRDGATFGVHLANRRRVEHVAILGKSGSGKTNLLLSLALQHFDRNEGFIFFDFHGDATAHLLRLAAAQPDVDEHLILVDLSDPERSPGINPLESIRGDEVSGHASELASILRRRWQVDSFGARTEELLRNTLHTLSECGHSIVEIPLLLTSGPFRASLVESLTNAEVRQYWVERYDPLSDAMKASGDLHVLSLGGEAQPTVSKSRSSRRALSAAEARNASLHHVRRSSEVLRRLLGSRPTTVHVYPPHRDAQGRSGAPDMGGRQFRARRGVHSGEARLGMAAKNQRTHHPDFAGTARCTRRPVREPN
jgi:hypothetical protein